MDTLGEEVAEFDATVSNSLVCRASASKGDTRLSCSRVGLNGKPRGTLISSCGAKDDGMVAERFERAFVTSDMCRDGKGGTVELWTADWPFALFGDV